MELIVNGTLGYRWYTFGCGRWWLKCGPLAITTFCWHGRGIFEVHWCNRIVFAMPDWRKS